MRVTNLQTNASSELQEHEWAGDTHTSYGLPEQYICSTILVITKLTNRGTLADRHNIQMKRFGMCWFLPPEPAVLRKLMYIGFVYLFARRYWFIQECCESFSFCS